MRSCSDGADRVAPLRTGPAGDRAAPLSSDALGCRNFRLQFVRFADSTNDPAPVVAALTEAGSSGVERAESIPVSGLTDMEAAESIPVGALAEVLQRQAPVTRPASPCAAASCEAAERPRLRTSCIRSSPNFAGSSISAPRISRTGAQIPFSMGGRRSRDTGPCVHALVVKIRRMVSTSTDRSRRIAEVSDCDGECSRLEGKRSLSLSDPIASFVSLGNSSSAPFRQARLAGLRRRAALRDCAGR